MERATAVLLLLLACWATCSLAAKRSVRRSTKISHKRQRYEPADRSTEVVVSEVKLPGATFIPSTGKLLQVYEMNGKVLRGQFITSAGARIQFVSSCSGRLELRHDAMPLLRVTKLGTSKLHFGKLGRNAFVYDDLQSHVYELPRLPSERRRIKSKNTERKRTQRSVEEHWHRSKRSGAPTAEKDLFKAESRLMKNVYIRQLPRLVQALGEFGIVGSESRCAKPLIMAGMDVDKEVHTGMNGTAMDDVMSKAGERRRQLYNKRVKELQVARPRVKRWGSFRRVVRHVSRAVRRVARHVGKAVKKAAGHVTRFIGKAVVYAGKLVIRHIVYKPIRGVLRLFVPRPQPYYVEGQSAPVEPTCTAANTVKQGKQCLFRDYTKGGIWDKCSDCSNEDGDCYPDGDGPCKCLQCPGLCGRGCSCSWTKVLCGNCCYNKGCFERDVCCASARPGRKVCTPSLTVATYFDCADGFAFYPNCRVFRGHTIPSKLPSGPLPQ